MLPLVSLSLLFIFVAANLGSYRNFTHTCESVYSYGDEHRNISAVCSRDATVSHLDLNDCIGNVQGQLVVGPQWFLLDNRGRVMLTATADSARIGTT